VERGEHSSGVHLRVGRSGCSLLMARGRGKNRKEKNKGESFQCPFANVEHVFLFKLSNFQAETRRKTDLGNSRVKTLDFPGKGDQTDHEGRQRHCLSVAVEVLLIHWKSNCFSGVQICIGLMRVSSNVPTKSSCSINVPPNLQFPWRKNLHTAIVR
jgi:hypothetical protein